MTISAKAKAAGALVLLGVAGCGSDSSAPTAQQACSTLAQAQCEKRMTCSNGTSITRVFGTMDTCVSRETLTCMNALAAPETGNSPALVDECVAALSSASCADFFDNNPPSVCAPMGPAAAGEPCVFNGQCASAYCSGTKDALCGTCAAPPAAGSSCESSTCDHGQVCVNTTMLCEDEAGLGSSCDASDPCGYGLSCLGAVVSTSTPGMCQTAIAHAGSSCGGTLPGCDNTLGLFCGGSTGSKTCMPITYVSDGAPCGDLSSTSRAECIAGGCYTSTGLAAFQDTGTCKADATDGSACDTVLGPACQPPARCVVDGPGSAGTCALPTGASCS